MMADTDAISLKNALSSTAPVVITGEQPIPGHPREQFEVQEAGQNEEDTTVYPEGPKLWLNMASIMLCCFLRGLDLTIVAVAVPSLTNEFKTVSDIGWYNAAYGMVASATVFFFGKAYTVFDVKKMYMLSIFTFWVGSIVCTFTTSSHMFVFGRALGGLGAAWQAGGFTLQLNLSFPLHKRSYIAGILSFTQCVAMVGAPVIGGGLIQRFNWRACFGINIPLNAVSILFTWYGMQTPTYNPDVNLPFREKFKRLDIPSTIVFIPALTCLLMALQFGGSKYGWKDGRVIALIVVSVTLLTLFAYLQYRLGEKATVPPRIVKQRSILAATWFNCCCDATLATTEYYISIYFQGVRGLTPAKSGLLGVPMIVGLAASSLIAGTGIGIIGYYTPFMLLTSIVSPIASGLLTTLDLDSQVGKAAGLLGLLGFALGMGMQGPLMAITTTLKTQDVAVGTAVVGFGAGMGSAIFVSTAAVLFQGRLADEVSRSAPGTNITVIENAGLSDIRKAIGPDRLKQVLVGYDKAVVQTLYIPLALTILTIVGSALTEWRSVKKKQS